MMCVWIEIPAARLERAMAFYEAVFQYERGDILEEDGRRITLIDGTPTASLNETAGFVPTAEGSVPYFHLEGVLDDALARVTAAGGRILEPAAARADRGVFSLIADSEGNALYLHAAS